MVRVFSNLKNFHGLLCVPRSRQAHTIPPLARGRAKRKKKSLRSGTLFKAQARAAVLAKGGGERKGKAKNTIYSKKDVEKGDVEFRRRMRGTELAVGSGHWSGSRWFRYLFLAPSDASWG